ncbi:MAG: glutathione S-transferase family protein [Betaproteobacteria bacterium]
MALTFYYGSGSPFAWRVWLALEYKGIAYQQKVVSFSAGDLRTPEYQAINPRRKVPAIVDEDFALYESQAIVEYLDERFPQAPRLFPGDVRHRALVRRMVQEADQYFIVAMDPLIDHVLFGPREQWDEPIIADARSRFGRELARWETIFLGDWLTGTAPTAADFALYPHIALALRMDRKKPDLDVRGLIGPRFLAWMQRVEALPILRKTLPPHWKD